MDKIIHYCWFGRSKKPHVVKKCIQSWKKKLIGWTFLEWNEDNFNVNSTQYTKRAYELKKYAFVADYVRIYAVYHYGGVYLDCDELIIKDFSNLLKTPFFCLQEPGKICNGVFGCEKNDAVLGDILNEYNNLDYCTKDDRPIIFGARLIMNRLDPLERKDQTSFNRGYLILSSEYFNPKRWNWLKSEYYQSKNTYGIHFFQKSWGIRHITFKQNFYRMLSAVFGLRFVDKCLRKSKIN